MNRKLYTAEELEEAVNKYFSDCKADDVFPDEAGMISFLDISESTYERYSKDDKMKSIIARARADRESWLVRRMTGEPKLAQGCLNALKQPKNGGYTDRPVDDKPREFVVTIKGAGADPFK